MLFIAKPQTELYAAIAVLMQQCDLYQFTTRAFVQEWGGKSYYLPYDSIAGGIEAVVFPEEATPDTKLWKPAPKRMKCPSGYIPRPKTPLAIMFLGMGLYKVTSADVAELVGFQAFSRRHSTRIAASVTTYTPGIKPAGGTWVFDYPDGYNLYVHPDLVEITHTQYNAMKAATHQQTDGTPEPLTLDALHTRLTETAVNVREKHINYLKISLKEAIDREDYEMAARLRDELNQPAPEINQ